MKKKWKVIWSACIAAILLVIGTFIFYPEWFFLGTSLTYSEAIQTNWGVAIPNPDQETTIKNERHFHGDGETITKLTYEKLVI